MRQYRQQALRRTISTILQRLLRSRLWSLSVMMRKVILSILLLHLIRISLRRRRILTSRQQHLHRLHLSKIIRHLHLRQMILRRHLSRQILHLLKSLQILHLQQHLSRPIRRRSRQIRRRRIMVVETKAEITEADPVFEQTNIYRAVSYEAALFIFLKTSRKLPFTGILQE